MGPTKLPNPKSLRPLVVPKRQRERVSISNALPNAQIRRISVSQERDTAYSIAIHPPSSETVDPKSPVSAPNCRAYSSRAAAAASSSPAPPPPAASLLSIGPAS